jgi:predicted adenylyl cyclase CyaB
MLCVLSIILELPTMSHSYEIEIKSLLGTEDQARLFKERLFKKYPSARLLGKNTQLNHYFVDGNLAMLCEKISSRLKDDEVQRLEKIVKEGTTFSIRARSIKGKTLLVIKASITQHTSDNGVSRIEFETEIKDVSLEELDQIILSCGFSYQAKWSREREEYDLGSVTVCLDKNAGYGYVAEFEKVITDASTNDAAIEELHAVMLELEVEELDQERLARMFDFYNKHWSEYYGTEKVFTIT